MATNSTKRLPSGIEKRGGVYWSNIRHHGKRVRKPLSRNLRTARELLADLRGKLVRGDAGLMDNNCRWRDVRDLFLKWAGQNKAERTFEQYERDIRAFEAFSVPATVAGITPDLALSYRAQLIEKGDCPRTINRKVGVIQNALNRAADPEGLRLIASNPIKGVEPLKHTSLRKQRRALSVEEVDAILQEAPDYLRPILRLFLTTGIRRDELIDLRFGDIDWAAQAMTVRADVAKNDKARTIPLDDGVMAMLVELKEQAADREPHPRAPGRFSRDHVFVTAWNTPRRNNLLRAFKAVCRRAGIEGAESWGSVDLHALRGTFTTHAIDGRANPKAVQEILGHSTLAVTMNVYAKTSDRMKREAISSLPFAKASAPEHVLEIAGHNLATVAKRDDATRHAASA